MPNGDGAQLPSGNGVVSASIINPDVDALLTPPHIAVLGEGGINAQGGVRRRHSGSGVARLANATAQEVAHQGRGAVQVKG